MSKLALTSLAVLKVNWDSYKKSYTDHFVPLVAECIRASNKLVVSLPEVQGGMLTDFGLRIPAHSLKVILTRLEKKGGVRKEHGAYHPNDRALQTLSIKDTKQRVLKHHDATINRLIGFVREKYNVTWSDKDAEAALLSFLAAYDLDILRAATEGTLIPPIDRSIRNAGFLVSAFTRYIYENDSVAFSYLETITKGHLLANALFFPDISAVTRKFRNTRVFLDTRVILNALGYNGTAYQAPCRELLDLLHEEGTELRCFRHTYDELHGIFNAIASRFDKGIPAEAYDLVTRTFRDRGASESDVLLAMTTMGRDLDRLRIKIEEKPPYAATYQIDEGVLDKNLGDSIHYKKDSSRIRDVDSLSAIYKLRRGQEYPIIEECRALFVTTNIRLVRASTEFFKSYQSAGNAPVCVTDHHLTTILWLKKPMMVPDLPMKRLIADSYAAMEPSEDLWRKFLAEVKKLQKRGEITAEEVLALRSTIEARSLLMDTTLGNPEVFVEGTIEEILVEYRRTVRAEIEAKRLAAERRGNKLQQQLDTINLQIEAVADWIATVIAKGLFVAFIILLAIGTYASISSPALSSWLAYSFFAAQLVLLLLSLANLSYGVTVKKIIRRIEKTLRGTFAVWLKKAFGALPR